MKHRTHLLDYETALNAANLCLANLDVIRESTELTTRECAFTVACVQYETVRRYALDVQGWCRNCGLECDRVILRTAVELRSNLIRARRQIAGELN